MKKTYLITGATGFVGASIVRELAERGENVNILVRNKQLNWRLYDIASQINVHECDLLNSRLGKVIDEIKPTIIFHLAALGALPTDKTDTSQFIDTNVKGLIQLIEAAKKHDIQRFVNTGSSSEYGIKNSSMRESDLLEPINDYGVTKAAATLFSQKIAKLYKLPIITLRLFSPYGFFDDKKRLIAYVIIQALRDEPIYLSSKTNVRDFIYIDDVIQAYFNSEDEKIAPGEIINIGSGKQHSVYNIVKQIIAISGSKSSVNWDNSRKQSRQIEPANWQANIYKAKKLLKWQPKFSLEEGLKDAIGQYKQLYK